MKTVSATIDTQLYKTELQAKNHIIISDEPETVGGQNLGLTPTELLESALASCSAMTIRMYANKKGWDVKKVIVNVGFKRNITTQTVTFKKDIELIGNLDNEQRQRLLEMGANCPIEKMLKGTIKVESHLKQ